MTSSSSTSIKTFYVENLGCAKNQVDAEVIIASLKRRGWRYERDEPSGADLIIVNTCGFIQSAKEEATNTLIGACRDHPESRVMAAGCFAQRYADDLHRLIPELAGIFGNRAPQRVGEIVDRVMAGERPVFLPEGPDRAEERRDFFSFDRSVFVKIADGCDNNCRYCAIPLIKGRLQSRGADEVVAEVGGLLDRGAFEINLVAQDLAGWGQGGGDRGDENLLDLLKRLLDRSGEFWIRLLYLHPDHFPEGLTDLMASDSRLLDYLDIPFQHASPSVLRKMGRAGNSGRYLDLLRSIRSKLSDATIRSTFLVGHPGEGRREFDELLAFQEAAEIDWLGAFAWSREEDTAAAGDRGPWAARIAAPTGEHRRRVVEEAQRSITERRLDRWVGKELDMLAEESIPDEDLLLGRGAPHAPEVDGTVVISAPGYSPGEVIRCRVAKRNGIDLEAVAAESGVPV